MGNEVNEVEITSDMVNDAIETAKQESYDVTERPPECFLPEGDSVIRLWTGDNGGKLEWLREAWVFMRKGVGRWDGDCDFIRGLSARAKANDPDKAWSWRFQAGRWGIIKGCIYQDANTPLASGADTKYVRSNIPIIIALPNQALKSFKGFIQGQAPDQLRKQLDPDSPAMGIKFSLKKGSGGGCNVSWDLRDRELPSPFTWGDNQPFPHLQDCFVNSLSLPTKEQEDILNAELDAKIGGASGATPAPANVVAPVVPTAPAPAHAGAPPGHPASQPTGQFQDDDEPF